MADYVDRMNGGVHTIGSKSTFERNIRALEKEKNQLAEIIGNKVYEFCVNNPGADIPYSEIHSIFNEMNLRDQHIKIQQDKIVEYENEIRRSQGGVQCSCGYVNVVGVRFCEKCGNPVVPIINGVGCSCGHVNSSSAKFCAKCGAAVGSSNPNGNSQCPCGHVNVAGAKFCAKCGNKIG